MSLRDKIEDILDGTRWRIHELKPDELILRDDVNDRWSCSRGLDSPGCLEALALFVDLTHEQSEAHAEFNQLLTTRGFVDLDTPAGKALQRRMYGARLRVVK